MKIRKSWQLIYILIFPEREATLRSKFYNIVKLKNIYRKNARDENFKISLNIFNKKNFILKFLVQGFFNFQGVNIYPF